MSTLLPATSQLFMTSFKLSTIDSHIFPVATVRTGMHCLTMSFQNHSSNHADISWKLFCFNALSAVSTLVDCAEILIMKATIKSYW